MSGRVLWGLGGGSWSSPGVSQEGNCLQLWHSTLIKDICCLQQQGEWSISEGKWREGTLITGSKANYSITWLYQDAWVTVWTTIILFNKEKPPKSSRVNATTNLSNASRPKFVTKWWVSERNWYLSHFLISVPFACNSTTVALLVAWTLGRLHKCRDMWHPTSACFPWGNGDSVRLPAIRLTGSKVDGICTDARDRCRMVAWREWQPWLLTFCSWGRVWQAHQLHWHRCDLQRGRPS